MIASVSGTVAAVGPGGGVIEVGGIGIAVQCAPGTLAGLRVGQPVRLATSLVVREDSLTLYGFADDDERALFELLQTASGVGPRLAQATLAVLNPREIRAAVATGDLVVLTRVPGIGKKGAERLVLELRDRIGGVDDGEQVVAPTAAAEPAWRAQVRQGLLGLGWRTGEVEETLELLARQVGASGSPPQVPVLLKSAIGLLGRR